MAGAEPKKFIRLVCRGGRDREAEVVDGAADARFGAGVVMVVVVSLEAAGDQFRDSGCRRDAFCACIKSYLF